MVKRDARKLLPQELEALREAALYMRGQDCGITAIEVSEKLGVDRTTVGRWFKQYRIYGNVNHPARERGRKVGAVQVLSNSEWAHLVAIFLTRSPLNLGLSSSLWNRRQIADLILNEWGLEVKPDYVPRLLRQCQFPAQVRPSTPESARYENILTGEPVCIRSEFSGVGRTHRRRQAWIAAYPVAHQLQECVLKRLDKSLLPDFEADLSKPRALLCAHDPRGRIQFRCYRSPISPTAQSGFLQLLGSSDATPVSVLFLKRFRLTATGRKWLQHNKEKVLAVCPTILIDEPVRAQSKDLLLTRGWSPAWSGSQ